MSVDRDRRAAREGIAPFLAEMVADPPVGDPDDVAAHVEAMGAAGVHSLAFFPPPDVGRAGAQLGLVLAEVIGRR